jgi:lysozyme
MKGWRLALAALGAAGGTLALGGALYAPHWHPSERSWPLQGIDVSHHQGPIDWHKLPPQGVDLAWIKATEGGDHRDRMFAVNWAGARAAGIRRGAYHFFTLCRSGTDQAANFVAAVPREADALPPAVDLEFGGNCAARPSREMLLRELGAFLRIVEAHSGRRALLYLTHEFEEAYRVSAAIDRPLWLRALVFQPRFGARPWTVWQVSSFRSLRGIEGGVDWNVLRR